MAETTPTAHVLLPKPNNKSIKVYLDPQILEAYEQAYLSFCAGRQESPDRHEPVPNLLKAAETRQK